MEQWMERPVWAEIDLRTLKKNIEIVQSRIAPGAEMLAIVKGNCYGHGLTECVPVMAGCGVRNFGVATLVEAREVRRLAGPECPHLVERSRPAGTDHRGDGLCRHRHGPHWLSMG